MFALLIPSAKAGVRSLVCTYLPIIQFVLMNYAYIFLYINQFCRHVCRRPPTPPVPFARSPRRRWQDANNDEKSTCAPLSTSKEIQQLREQLEQQALQTRQALAQLMLVREQLITETNARIEAQVGVVTIIAGVARRRRSVFVGGA